MRLDLLVNDFTYRAVVDRFVVLFEAHFKRNYIHVRDVARAFCHALDHFDEMQGQPYNVGLSDANLSKMELCQEIQKQIPDFTVKGSPDRRRSRPAELYRQQRQIEGLAARPQVSIQRAIAELIKGYQVVRRNQHATQPRGDRGMAPRSKVFTFYVKLRESFYVLRKKLRGSDPHGLPRG